METYFYKIMVSPSTQTKELRIPKNYVSEYREQLAKGYVKLGVDDGRVWKVKVYKENDQVWLTKGWERVVKRYSIKYGYFLLLRYDYRDSVFHLTIFKTTGCKIEYDQELIEISSQSEEMDLDDADYDIVSSEDDIVVHEEMNVRERLEAFESKNPHFKHVMRPYNVSKAHRISMPIRHTRAHLKPSDRELIFKVTGQVKSFYINITVYPNGQVPLGSGWKDFVWENDLHVGDGCVFELIRPRSNAYKITIFRARGCILKLSSSWSALGAMRTRLPSFVQSCARGCLVKYC